MSARSAGTGKQKAGTGGQKHKYAPECVHGITGWCLLSSPRCRHSPCRDECIVANRLSMPTMSNGGNSVEQSHDLSPSLRPGSRNIRGAAGRCLRLRQPRWRPQRRLGRPGRRERRQADVRLQLRWAPQGLGRGRVQLRQQHAGHLHGAAALCPVLRAAPADHRPHDRRGLPRRVAGGLPLHGGLPRRPLPDERGRERRPVLQHRVRRPDGSGRRGQGRCGVERSLREGSGAALRGPAGHPPVVPERLWGLLQERQ